MKLWIRNWTEEAIVSSVRFGRKSRTRRGNSTYSSTSVYITYWPPKTQPRKFQEKKPSPPKSLPLSFLSSSFSFSLSCGKEKKKKPPKERLIHTLEHTNNAEAASGSRFEIFLQACHHSWLCSVWRFSWVPEATQSQFFSSQWKEPCCKIHSFWCPRIQIVFF